MRPLKICDIVITKEIDYNKGFKSLSDCEFVERNEKIYKIIDVDFIKYIEYGDGPCFNIFFKDNTNMELDKIHLNKIILSLER